MVLFYTTYISVDAHHEECNAKVGKGGRPTMAFATVLLTKSDSDDMFCSHLLSKTLT